MSSLIRQKYLARKETDASSDDPPTITILQIAWYSHVVINTLIEHSGYHLPLLQSSEYHDFHLLKFDQNFGTFDLLDRFHGTDAKWRAPTSGTFERHRILLGPKSARELFPLESERKKQG